MKYTVITSHGKTIYSGNDLMLARNTMYAHNDSHKRSKAVLQYNTDDHTSDELEVLGVTTFEQIKEKHDIEQAFGEYEPLAVDFAEEFINNNDNVFIDTDQHFDSY